LSHPTYAGRDSPPAPNVGTTQGHKDTRTQGHKARISPAILRIKRGDLVTHDIGNMVGYALAVMTHRETIAAAEEFFFHALESHR
jgi:hypothetical protein